ncbi:DUF427 domain-containing protein [Bradyrhizobium sp. BR13661]|uniref:DUF427 domain-containing protein n=1 Tax=Bradyrhizobium sp. BR13661 TaxID=2940622 RepID=UPI002473EBC9|nr:DUF427 domain-containing protein [Bradyrhizobium sp. BR13661]MDH6262937.1 uncharacterized protein (DUF427 family) [Bradyrhizobium sp. BR13661]
MTERTIRIPGPDHPITIEHSTDAIWTYEAPYEAVVDINSHLAFYPDRVDAIEEQAA